MFNFLRDVNKTENVISEHVSELVYHANDVNSAIIEIIDNIHHDRYTCFHDIADDLRNIAMR